MAKKFTCLFFYMVIFQSYLFAINETEIPLVLKEDEQLSFQLGEDDFKTIISNAIDVKENITSKYYLATGLFTGLTSLLSSIISRSLCYYDDDGYCFPVTITFSSGLCLVASYIAFKGYKKIITGTIKDYIMQSLARIAIQQTRERVIQQ